MLTTFEKLFCEALDRSIPALTDIDVTFRERGAEAAEKQLADYIRISLRTEDYFTVPYHGRENVWASPDDDDFAAAASEMPQTVAMVADGSDEGGNDVIRHEGRVDEGVEGVMPAEGHADARLDGAPALGGVEGGVGGADGLPAPAHHQINESLGVLLVSREAVTVAEASPFGVPGQLPRPFGILIGGGIALPIYVGSIGKFMGKPAGAKLALEDLFGRL